MKHTSHLNLLASTVLIVSLSVPRSASQRPNYNTPVNSWNNGDRTPLTGNRGNFYNPIYGNNGKQRQPYHSNLSHSSNNNPGYPTNGNRSQPHMIPGPQDQGSQPRPANQVYPWNFQPSAHNNPASANTPPLHSPGQNNGYTPRPHPVNQWSPHPTNPPPTQPPNRWTDNNEPRDRSQQFDLVDFNSLPDSYKTAFMSVEELVRNRGIVFPPGPNSANVVVVFNQQTQELLDPALQSLVSNILPTLVPGAWRSMTFVQGCCSALRYHAANESLANVNGQQKRIVHFSKYNPPMYQFIPHGLCANVDYSSNGHCLQGTVTMTLLVYDLRFNPPLSFDVFNIPTYCNCVQF